MRFRPCIDLRNGRVVQIVGSSLKEKNDAQTAHTLFETERSSADYAQQYRADRLSGGHIISLGEGNQEAALAALAAHPGGLQFGGGVTPDNAKTYLDAGASHVIVTSYVFREGRIDYQRLKRLVAIVGKQRLVLDLSCRRRGNAFWVVTDRWQRFTQIQVSPTTLQTLSTHCAEFLIHGVDVEGRQTGIEDQLVTLLGAATPIPVTYAGGAKTLADLDHVKTLGQGRIDLTIGSALDLFGGPLPYRDVVAWQRRQESKSVTNSAIFSKDQKGQPDNNP